MPQFISQRASHERLFATPPQRDLLRFIFAERERVCALVGCRIANAKRQSSETDCFGYDEWPFPHRFRSFMQRLLLLQPLNGSRCFIHSQPHQPFFSFSVLVVLSHRRRLRDKNIFITINNIDNKDDDDAGTEITASHAKLVRQKKSSAGVQCFCMGASTNNEFPHKQNKMKTNIEMNTTKHSAKLRRSEKLSVHIETSIRYLRYNNFWLPLIHNLFRMPMFVPFTGC